jgi:phospholipid/cholesterol/gamma-HCH transport system substrate-binding protein
MGELGETVSSVRNLSDQLAKVAAMMSPDGQLAHTITNFHRTSEELQLVVSENRAQFRETMRNFTDASGTAKRLTTDREADLRKAIDNFASSAEKMDQLTGRLDSLRAVVQTVASRVEGGEGTLGKLIKDEQLYADLNSTVQSMKVLIEDVKKNPKKYFKFSVF